jgi:lambda family phage portal protein
MLAGMEEANLVAARVGSANMGFFTRPLEEGDGRLRDELSFSDHGTDLIDSAEPGSFRELPPGYDFKSFDPKVPQDSFAPFVKSMLRAVSSGLPAGSYNSIANDRESTSYSSLRHAWLDETDAYKELQSWLIDSLNRPVYQAWLKSLYLSGKLNISAIEMNECLEPQFVPRRWGFIDPLKQTRSDIESLAAGIKSKSEVVSDNGKSYDDLAHELKIEKEIDKSLGLSPVEIKPSGGD